MMRFLLLLPGLKQSDYFWPMHHSKFSNVPVWDVKSAFLYGTIEEEVYVSQPLGFMDLEFPEKVYKVEKALYGLHQAPRALILSNNEQKVPDEFNGRASHSSWVYKSSRERMGSSKSRTTFSDSDYTGASLDRKSTIGGCQFLGSRLISWQCKKQTVVANSNTEAEYIAASHCCGQSVICVVKNPVYHSKTKHIEIRHHFIRDSYEKRLIEMVKIYTDNNVADLLTKSFDLGVTYLYADMELCTKHLEGHVRRASRSGFYPLIDAGVFFDIKRICDFSHITVEPKSVRKNSFRPPVIEDWNSDDDSEVEFIPNVENKSVRPSTEKIKFVKSARETVEKEANPQHMTGNKCYLTEYEDYDGGFVSFGDGKGRISRKGKIKTGTLDFDNVYFCKELKYNMFSVSQICDKKNNVLFTDTECLVLSSDFKLLDESQVLLRVLRKDNIYSVKLKSIVPTKGLTCLFAKATINESKLWHMRVAHINFKNINKLVKGNLCFARTPQLNGLLREEYNTARRVKVNKSYKEHLKNLSLKRPPLDRLHEPFGCPVTILNTRDNLGKFDEKADEGFFLEKQTNSTNSFNTVGTPVSAAGPTFTNDDPLSLVHAAEASNAFEDHLIERFSPFKNSFALPHVLNVFLIDDTGIFGNSYNDEDVGAKADLNNLERTMKFSH
ncbi:ribonuclease H-like domain-containing protein [Tanacetum coccineum]